MKKMNNDKVRLVAIIIAALVLIALIYYYYKNTTTSRKEYFSELDAGVYTSPNQKITSSSTSRVAPSAPPTRGIASTSAAMYEPMPVEPSSNEYYLPPPATKQSSSYYLKPQKNSFPQDRISPQDLLPKDAANTKWAQANPAGQGDVRDINLLNSGFHIGVNTQGNSLRNASHDIRSEPLNPQYKVSIWNNATIEGDLNRKPLE